MYKNFITLLICSLLTLAAFGQGWVQYYHSGGLYTDVGYMTLDEGFVLGGRIGNSPGYHIIKTNSLGDTQWTNYYTSSQGAVSLGDLVPTGDGGYALCTTVDNNGSDMLTITKLDSSGTFLWEQTHNLSPSPAGLYKDYGQVIIENDNGDLVVAGNTYFDNQSSPVQVPFVMKLDAQGNFIWQQTFLNGSSVNNNFEVNDLIALSNGGYAFAGFYDQPSISSPEVGFVMATDIDGGLLWNSNLNVFAKANALIENDAGSIVVVGQSSPLNNIANLSIASLGADGIINNEHQYLLSDPGNSDPLGSWALDVKQTPDGGYAISGGEYYNVISNGMFTDYNTQLLKANSDFSLDFRKSMTNYGMGEGNHLEVDENGELIILGGLFLKHNVGDDDRGSFIVKTTAEGEFFSNHIIGKVYYDVDEDCSLDNNDDPLLAGWFVVAEGTETYYGMTDSTGNYNILCDTGSYVVHATPINGLWEHTCSPNGLDVSFPDYYTSDFGNNIPFTALYDCPFMTVDISANFFRRCFDNTIVVNYGNEGTVDETNALIEVVLDPDFVYQSSSIALGGQSGDTLFFDMGELPVGASGSFKITAYLDCDSTQLGENHCNEAHIFPDTFCFPLSADWDGSEVRLSVACVEEGDSVIFSIQNAGGGDMLDSRTYYVFEDHIMREQNIFQLTSGETLEFGYKSVGATWRLIAEQAEGHPSFSTLESVVLEGCVPTFGDPISLNFVNIFNDYSEEPYYSIDCQPNIGAFDPNDKAAVPIGYGEEHYIDLEDKIEYKIRFQNTGTDTAFTVVVRDSISEFLDPTSITSISASHSYIMSFTGTGLVEFRFDNILLPDSTVNNEGSNGYIKFEISQRAGNPLGTVIENNADIYFDFNEPIRTNTTFHTLGIKEEYFISFVISEPSFEGMDVAVIPNPFSEKALIRIEGQPDMERFNFELMDISGRMVLSEGIQRTYSLNRNGLPPGLYFFSLKTTDGILMGTGKLIIQ